ncbi:uncharacterized protein [Physcomitrium patens]|uniref:HMA domain-containing protein n=1 Tax=Physcomitrium patens TaxID=3218 RepID=A0A2K1J0T8_PHYPA|nr:nucleolar protein 9-like [Physcomitrium patens]PNR35148.1 hypothetical protein PHYPA_023047 [Physcomitrium patens]|eukprot:XP_024403020.1 nucleolar protein 9-like [Physcomitrella patens]
MDNVPIYFKELKEVPEWMWPNHAWQLAVNINNLEKVQLKVKMCCSKCVEKVVEEIREVPGVFNVRAERPSKVVVVKMPKPIEVDCHEVLRKARKIHRKAKFVELDAKEKPKKEDDKKKEEEKKKKKEAEEKKKKKEAEEQKRMEQTLPPSISTIWWGKGPVHWAGSGFSAPTWIPRDYTPSQSYWPRDYYDYPPLPNAPEDGFYRRYVYYN